MNQPFKRTERQKEQTKILASDARHAMCYGGSRSGKTFGICRALVIRALKCKSRHLATRLKFNHAKTSLWYETFPKVFDICFPELEVKENKTDWFYLLPNGSEIWIGGLDEKERVEKILGKEYSTIFFNECSQIPYTSVNMALTRLAEKNELKKRAWYDENPPNRRHWSFALFMKGLDPETWEPRNDVHNYASILMNPKDNIENIDDEYISGVLDQMPERERKRFRDGEFTEDASGSIYYAFKRHNYASTPIARNPHFPIVVGMDFNVNPMTAVIAQIYDNKIHVIDEMWLTHSNTHEAAKWIKKKYPGLWTLIPDSTGSALKTSSAGLSDHQILKDEGFRIPFVQNPFRMDRYNEVNALLEQGRLLIDPKCKNLIKDLEQVGFKEGTNLPDTKDASLTHISDALGYLAHWAFPIVKTSSGVSQRDR